MQFLVTAYDYTGKDGLNRRISAREKHVSFSNELIKKGQMIFGVALLDKNGKMIGSSCVYEFPTKEDLQNMLKSEPYVTEKVWEKIEIEVCKVGPSFEKRGF